MQKRFSGRSCAPMLKRLPRNLVVIDGRCLMCRSAAQYAIERNFNFFSVLSYLAAEEQATARGDYRLDKHRLHFSSIHAPEFDEIRRTFLTTGKGGGAAAAASSDRITPGPDMAVLFIEKVPSRTASFLHRLGRPLDPRGAAAASDAALFTPTAEKERQRMVGRRNSGAAQHVDTAQLSDARTTDLLVSTDFVALCRAGMHLDRRLAALAFTAAYWLVPRPLGTWWFERYVNQRRRHIWGTSEKDAVLDLGGADAVEGMKERRWMWRGK